MSICSRAVSVLHHVPVTLGGITLLLLVSSSHADESEAEDQNIHELNYRTEKLELQDGCDGVEMTLLAEGRRKDGSQRSHYLSQNWSVQRPVTLWLRPPVMTSQCHSLWRADKPLSSSASERSIIKSSPITLSFSLLCCVFDQTSDSAGEQGASGEPGPKPPHLKREGFFCCFLKAQHGTEASSLTPVGQTTSLDVASLFLFSSLDILVHFRKRRSEFAPSQTALGLKFTAQFSKEAPFVF